MEIIISILVLFIVVNCILKLSFWRGWQAAVFGLVCGVFVAATYPYAILQSKTQLADYLENTVALKNMAVIVTLESVVCFAYCIAVLQGARRQRWWMRLLKWYPSLLLFPVLFYLQTELIFGFPGADFTTISPEPSSYSCRCCACFSCVCCPRGRCGSKSTSSQASLSASSVC